MSDHYETLKRTLSAGLLAGSLVGLNDSYAVAADAAAKAPQRAASQVTAETPCSKPKAVKKAKKNKSKRGKKKYKVTSNKWNHHCKKLDLIPKGSRAGGCMLDYCNDTLSKLRAFDRHSDLYATSPWFRKEKMTLRDAYKSHVKHLRLIRNSKRRIKSNSCKLKKKELKTDLNTRMNSTLLALHKAEKKIEPRYDKLKAEYKAQRSIDLSNVLKGVSWGAELGGAFVQSADADVYVPLAGVSATKGKNKLSLYGGMGNRESKGPRNGVSGSAGPVSFSGYNQTITNLDASMIGLDYMRELKEGWRLGGGVNVEMIAERVEREINEKNYIAGVKASDNTYRVRTGGVDKVNWKMALAVEKESKKGWTGKVRYTAGEGVNSVHVHVGKRFGHKAKK